MHKILSTLVCSGLCFTLICSTTNLSAQNTFDEVLTIFDNKGCSSNYCHGGENGLFSSANPESTYDYFINGEVQNEVAAQKGEKLVVPGYPERSFLYRKINDHLYANSTLEAEEGGVMPLNGTPLTDVEKETIRQWILFGAPETGKAFSDNTKQAFTDYYTDGGIGPLEAPPAPAEGEGFQIHLGSIFLQPNEELEYLKKHDLQLEDGLEVTRLELFMNDFSHHFILYKHNDGSAISEGLRLLTSIGDSPIVEGTEMVTAWQDNQNIELPEGTAFVWNETTVLDLNYHILNYSSSAPLAADMYLNVYTQPKGTAEREMFSSLVTYNGLLFIPAGEESIFSDPIFAENADINVWSISTHTHKYGTDYDLYLQNEEDEKFLQLFEGQYNTDYTQFTGFYDYAHPPIRYFDNFFEMPAGVQLLQEATFNNTGSTSVGWGLTTNNEMMISFLQYTVGNTHQEDMVLKDLQDSYSICHGPVELLDNYSSGVVGDGVTHNIFDPEVAGIGTHDLYIDCCDPETMTTRSIEVTPAEFEMLELANTPTDDGKSDLEATWVTGNITEDEINVQWSFNGAVIDGATSPNYTAEFNGIYTVEITGKDCQLSKEVNVTEATNTAIETVEFHEFSASPNPFSDNTQINFSLTQNSRVLAEIFDLSGKQIAVLANGQLNTGNHSLEFNPEKAGVYLLQLTIDKEVFTHKLIKQ